MTTLTTGSRAAGWTSWAGLGRGVLFLAALVCLALTTACGPAQTRPETALKPLEERRARGIIEQAVLDNGYRPLKGRVVKLADGTDMTEDMALEGEVYGIAYISAREAEMLGKSLPKRNPESEQLRLVRGTGGAIILLLWEADYRYDAGEEHTTTAVAAEGKLSRDVADFILHVVKQRKKR
ncbi:MAG: hypothetical protein DRI90_21755 [Deltaproteobacteria bacterium]|nr:MAG: hypothetical protein DRI90_21755 [Deltaproteobacteria bacterium]